MTIKALSMIHQSCVYEHTFFFHLLSLFSSCFFRHVGLFPSHHNRPLCSDGKAEPGGKLQFVFPSEGNRKKVLIYRSHLRASLSFPLLCSFLFFPLQQGLKSRCWKAAATTVQIWYERYKYPGKRSQSSGFYVSRSRNTMVDEELHDLWHTNDICRSIKASSPLLFRLASMNANRRICPPGWTLARNT